MSQTGIILNVQQQLEDILNNQQIIVQNQNDMFEKLNDIEKRLMNVETCLIIQQNSSQTKLGSSSGQLAGTNRSGLLSLSGAKSSPLSGTLASNNASNNFNNSTNNCSSNNSHSINNKLKQSLQYRNNNFTNSRLSLASSSSFLRSANLSPRFSLQNQRMLMQQQQLLNRQSAFSSHSSKHQPISYSHLSKRAKYELHHSKSAKDDASKIELEEGEKPNDSSSIHQDSGNEMGEELGEIAKKDTSMITNEDMGKDDENENDADDDDNESNVSSNLNLNIINKSMGSTSPSSYLKSTSGPNTSNAELLMLATDESSGHILINDTDIRRIYAVSKSRGNFAALLVQQMYARQERIMSNVMGTRGKRQLSPRRMIVVKRLAFKMYPPPNEREEEIIWKKECVKAIDSKNRKVRIQPGGHRNIVDTSSPNTSGSNSANTSLNRASAAAAAFAAAQHMRNPFQQLTPQQLSSLAAGHNQLARQNSAQAVAAMAAAAVAAAAAAHMSQTQVVQPPPQPPILPSSTSASIKQEANTSPQMVTSSTTSTTQNMSSKINTSTPNKEKDLSQNLIQVANFSKDNLDNSSSKTTADNDNLTDTSFNEADN